MKQNDWKRGFDEGTFAAVSHLLSRGEDTLAQEVLTNSNPSKKNADEFDKALLIKSKMLKLCK
jgi:hypothetical protein